MFGREEMRQILARMGYSQEQADEIINRYYPVISPPVFDVLCAAMQELAAAMAASFEEIVAQPSAVEIPQKKKLPRPPRYIGPKHNNPKQWQRPARVARSSCRKIRRHQ